MSLGTLQNPRDLPPPTGNNGKEKLPFNKMIQDGRSEEMA